MAKRIETLGFQGDVGLKRVATFPAGLVEAKRDGQRLIVTHSETGHHHVIDRARVTLYEDPTDPLTAWLEVHGDESLPQIAELVHERPWDTHETLEIPVGKWKIIRQREATPEGWRKVQD